MEGRLSLAALVGAALVAAPLWAGDVTWTTRSTDTADVRWAEFAVPDPDCAYATIADTGLMLDRLEHLEAVEIHRAADGFQDVTLTERFFPIGRVRSRYYRTFDGASLVEWRLIEGRQARLDGTWRVTRNPDGSGRVSFENLIQAKSLLHRPLLKRTQVRAMEAIVRVVQETCVQR